ncbi:hypothetical protein SAMN04489719_1738 [Agrococcus carbonis]|uniref:Uncharacterized protein n=1 Tax=Agrococcus carbonis TaxID=684552 RepID=A0A1H1Q584_9MICO|nr:hypothetical protein SAMN04489719_1738 [Agrococcus carbonis]
MTRAGSAGAILDRRCCGSRRGRRLFLRRSSRRRRRRIETIRCGRRHFLRRSRSARRRRTRLETRRCRRDSGRRPRLTAGHAREPSAQLLSGDRYRMVVRHLGARHLGTALRGHGPGRGVGLGHRRGGGRGRRGRRRCARRLLRRSRSGLRRRTRLETDRCRGRDACGRPRLAAGHARESTADGLAARAGGIGRRLADRGGLVTRVGSADALLDRRGSDRRRSDRRGGGLVTRAGFADGLLDRRGSDRRRGDGRRGDRRGGDLGGGGRGARRRPGLAAGRARQAAPQRDRRARARALPRDHRYAFRASSAAITCGTIVNRSPTTPRSAISKIGAFASLSIATIVFAVCMPARCWMAPEMPSAR